MEKQRGRRKKKTHILDKVGHTMGTSEVVLSAQLSAGELITEPCCKSVCVCVLMCALGAPIWWSSFSGESIRNRKSILNMKINVF